MMPPMPIACILIFILMLAINAAEEERKTAKVNAVNTGVIFGWFLKTR